MATHEQVAPKREANGDEAVRKLLEATRRRLVETGTRNRLIHVNRTNSRGSVINVVNERADDLYSILCTRKSMRFMAKGRDRDGTSMSAPSALGDQVAGDDGIDPNRFVDGFIETLLEPDSLEKKLLKIALEARTAEEEQGANILYLGIGFLKWFEDKNSKIPREAPLVLLPVELSRNQRTSTFDLRIREEEIVSNLALLIRLQDDFGLQLPELEVEENGSPRSTSTPFRQP